jgi:hypothetical protein
MKARDIYKYAFGTIEQIKNADFSNMLVSDEISDFSGFQSSTNFGVILPDFMGVYQERQYIEDPLDSEDDYSLPDILSDNIGLLAASLVFQGEYDDDMDHDLIAVVYDSKEWTSGLVRSLLGENSQRVAAIDRNNLPDFHKKDTYDRLSEIWDDIKNYTGTPKEKTKKLKDRWGSAIEKLSKQAKSYGLTQSEYMSYQAIMHLNE